MEPTESMKVTRADAVLSSRKAIISDAGQIYSPDEDLARIEQDLDEAEWISGYLAPGVEPKEPFSEILYPIIENAHHRIEPMDDDNDTENQPVVAVFSMTMYWRDTMKDILPEGSNGLRVVFESPCNPTFTYQINGPHVQFLGAGDIHEAKYNAMALKSLLTDLTRQDSSYSGLPLNEDFCPLLLTLYPTDQMKDAHTTSTPTYFAVVAVLIFLVTAATFLVYDIWVERRQKVMMETAVTSSALVSSLFPDVVRDRLLPSSTVSPDDAVPKSKLMSFLNDGTRNDNVYADGRADDQYKPIADLFPDTTVFFGDISGFTAWSEGREPSHVFTLLETLYLAFDRVARRHGVFKVETIGDSYVAVCGLPEPRKNHASAVARFAFECKEKMAETVRGLELALGPETCDLCLRIGLHSGPTIAGKRHSFL